MAGFYTEGLSANTALQQSQTIDTSFFNITPVRVKYTFINLEQLKTDNPELFKKYGEYFSLGGILFDSVSNPSPEDIEDNPLNNYIFAKPLFPNFRQIPLVNEIAYIITFPTPNLQDPNFIDLNDSGFYYFLPINLWNSVHHNALPDPLSTSTQTPSEKKDYQQVEAGSNQRVTDNTEDIDLGETFKERENIKALQPYEGDVIFEGRWGQSIRFGSTVKNTNNGWSENGEDGDPITIIRNGQGQQSGEPWIPMVEDINNLESSIWLSSTQQIPLSASSATYNSYPSNPPTKPSEYINKQLIFNSGRVVLNSTEDHILLSSKKSVNLNAVEGVNIDTPTTTIQSNTVLLGGKDATESVLKGDTTIDILSELVTELTKLTQALVTVTPQGGPAVAPAAQQLVPTLQAINTKLKNTTKSKISKTL
jgi:hypothetical protein